ncbi:hypothetical protein UFOVP167_17 [uncultured Caudovirales phage]|uniref:Uncharacterized protein n=1 Tax=uncultured Caudovirales phage TaxID=2100421 RepID=A0A6J7WF19_9CAUD|nr:hypothetical protein UFOVP167_17 [uncultured Caudovirales phage]
MDPITILAGCTAAYNAIKQGISVGKELQGMIGDVSSIMDSVGQLTQVAAKPKKPRMLSGKSAEAIAMEAYAAKKQAEAMMYEVRNAFIAEYGLNAWDIVQAEATKIKKQQKLAAEKAAHEAEVEREELMHNLVVFGSAIGLMVIVVIGMFVTFSMMHR